MTDLLKHLKASILRYKGMKIDDKVADELARHIAAILPELNHLGLIPESQVSESIRQVLRATLFEDAPKGVSTQKINRKGFRFIVWQNPDVAKDSDGQWQGAYLCHGGGWSETKPASRYGYTSKKEVLQHLLRLTTSMFNSTHQTPNTPWFLGSKLT